MILLGLANSLFGVANTTKVVAPIEAIIIGFSCRLTNNINRNTTAVAARL